MADTTSKVAVVLSAVAIAVSASVAYLQLQVTTQPGHHSPGGWVRSRMTAWQDPSRVSLPPVSAAAAARRAQLQAVQRQRG